jgi:amino acid transporter
VAHVVESVGEQRADSSAAQDHDVHGGTLHAEGRAIPASAVSEQMAGGVGSRNVPVSDSIKRLFVGRALTSERLGETMLPKVIALPVFASDALSSNAYATQEILLVLSLGGYSLYSYGPWVAAMVVVIYATVVASYRQTVHAYPSGGGDYEVVSHNLGPNWGVFVASALMIDYVLTVAVSISSGVANLGSTIPFVEHHSVWFAVAFTIVIMVLNLRGVKESGAFFAIPVYFFIFSIFVMIGFAIFQIATGHDLTAESANWTIIAENTFTGAALVFLVARAFSSGTTALTGIEAVANGVPAFKEPKSKNAATTLFLLGAISMTMFVGITWLALKTQVKVTESDSDLVGLPPGQPQKTVIVQVADAVFEGQHWAVLIIAFATAIILALAANTAFNGFPVLGSVLARDGYLPRQLHTRGDRLAFSNGILTLAGLAILLIIAYQASVSGLIQLYIIGVFVSFTLSQIGMVRHWTRLLRTEEDSSERKRMIRSRFINGFGLIMTASVLVIVLVTKFTKGAWIVVIAMPVIFLIMRGIHKHYERVSQEIMQVGDEPTMLPARVHVIVLVSKIHKPTLRALAYARASRPTVLEAVTVDVDHDDTLRLEEEWERQQIPVALKVLASPYREITRPILDYVRQLHTEYPNDLVTVYIPEYVVGRWWEQLLHNQSALRLKSRLLFTPGVMVTSVPWQLESSELVADREA